MRLKSPLNWFGGKGILQKEIVPLLPAHHLYVEPFAGAAQVLFAKPPSAVEVLNDLNSGLIHFFRVLRDPASFAQFERLCALTPYSREEWQEDKATWEATDDPVERAYRWFIVARMSFSGQFGTSWSSGKNFSRGGQSYAAYKWLHTIDGLAAVHARLLRVQFEHQDWRPILARYDSPATLFYLDPPYILSLRGRGGYEHEMPDADHAELVALLLRLQGKAIISGYAHPIYTPLEAAGWRRLDFQTFSFATGRTQVLHTTGAGAMAANRRTESLWLSPNCDRLQQLTMLPSALLPSAALS